MPGDRALEAHLRHYVRWNALAMVVRANKVSSELGGHVASFASAATLYDVGFNHFFRAPSGNVRRRPRLSCKATPRPGFYARAFLEGRIAEAQLEHFRQEVDGKGLSSYPHPWLMPDFWQFPTVSMGLGPIMSIYQARFMRYLHDRALIDARDRKVWAFHGDGEMDEPESLGAISLAGREKLDNLIWVINCNLQRLDGPVRGNGKIIQELEGVFKGAGWNVIKVVWGSNWDRLLRARHQRAARRADDRVRGRRLSNVQVARRQVRARSVFRTISGNCRARRRLERRRDLGAAAWRPRFAQSLRRLQARRRASRPADRRAGDDDQRLRHGRRRRSAEHRASSQENGSRGDAGRFAIALRFRSRMPSIEKIPFYKPPDDSSEMRYLRERVAALGQRSAAAAKIGGAGRTGARRHSTPQLKGTGDREISTTMSFVRILNTLVRDPAIGPRVVPIVADESRTFGMEGMFRQLGIYSSVGQLYHPQDAEQLMWYREDKLGQILQEGINEAGALFVVDRRRHVVFEPRPADDSVLHFLLDVRISTDRRLGVGRRGQPHARLLARRDLRPHDAQRRRSAARRRQQSSCGLVHSELPQLRSDLRLRSRDRSSKTACGGC